MNELPKKPDARLTPETIDYLKEQVAEAVQKGISGALNEETSEKFWAAGLSVLQKCANEHAGRFVLGSLWGLTRKLLVFLLLGGFVHAVGGWQALAGLWKVLGKDG